ncbi:DUF3823 domain-containing protein [Compostibacter hankyongensis]|uniref:DUF3823 domain-containing protein n=1 Tax=Compostibacter hankyongensis TaxID=1007089 RepID=A0ABP8FX72_9BACT
MKQIAHCFFYMILALLASSCNVFEIDPYDAPGATLQGKLTNEAGDPFITEQPNGFKIRIIENGSPTPRDFWGRPDGTFFNSKIFRGKYKIVATDGAFFPVDTVEADVSGTTTIDFKIIPYLIIEADITAHGGDLVATYKIHKAAGAGKIKNARLLVTKWNPNVGMNYNDKSVMRDLSGITDGAIEGAEFTDNIPGYLEKGVTYYARVAVLADNTLGRYNFSDVFEIAVP